MVPAFIHYIAWLYGERGATRYGEEAVTQLEHAQQCAGLAEAGGASEDLIAASFLHDIGHLMHETGGGVSQRAVSDRHEYRPMRMLRRHFGETVLAPIRLHVAAKRYLCAVEPGYWDGLSAASRRSLQAQGGIFTQAEAARFIRQPHAQNAVRLRLWDDRAKVPRRLTPGLPYLIDIVSRCAHGYRDPQSPS